MRKKDGSEFPPNTLHHIVCGIMRYLRWNGHPKIDFFSDTGFSQFKASLDAEMKRLQSCGKGSKKRQAEALTIDEEELLWEKGLLGDGTPQTLLDTMLFLNGLYFALRSGDEHRQLRLHSSQIELIEKSGERPYLKYVEDISKNRPGGIKGRKIKPKVVYHHANTTRPERCFVQLYKKYIQLCPPSTESNAFYLQPLKNPTSTCWYSKKPVGHNSLNNTMSRLCRVAGIKGYKTNHSLRATTATRLYQSGVEEQLVMERTGHRSLEGVRSYKRTSEQQREALSDILNNKVPRVEDSSVACSSPQQPPSMTGAIAYSPSNLQEQTSTQLSNTNIQTSTKNSLPGTFTFNSCASVTLNIHY